MKQLASGDGAVMVILERDSPCHTALGSLPPCPSASFYGTGYVFLLLLEVVV